MKRVFSFFCHILYRLKQALNYRAPSKTLGRAAKYPKLLAFDSYLNHTYYLLKKKFSELWEIATLLSRALQPHRLWRLTTEILDEFITCLAAGMFLFAFLAVPTLQITKNEWYNNENFSVTFLDRYGHPIGTRGMHHAQPVPIDEMPDYFIKAVLGTEDRRFFEHYGIDFLGLIRALHENMQADGIRQGGSTLTQQLAKNMFLNNERTLTRKIKEAFLALWLEANYSKKEILQLYLNRAYMGAGNFGVAAAAKFYFNEDIRHVSLAQAAMLAGLFKAPSKYAPHVNLKAAQARADVVLTNLVNSGYLTEGQVAAARTHPAETVLQSNHVQSPDYYLDWLFNDIKKLKDKLAYHDLIVKTTLDPNIQKIAELSVEDCLKNYGKAYHVEQGAAVVLSNNGAVRAMVGGRDYGESAFNRAVNGGRQAGSSFKTYIYAVMMERGLTPKTRIQDAPINWGGWQPRNSNRRYVGWVDLTTALTYSINTVPVRLTYTYLHGNTKPIRDLIKNMDVDAHILAHKTMVLGTSNMSALDQATGYNVFAAGGIAGTRHAYTEIRNENNKILWSWPENAKPQHRALSPKATAYMNQMLVQVPARGTGRRAAVPGVLIAGKTGTSQDCRDAWFVGYSGNYTTAVWMGNDNYKPTNNLYGGILPAIIFQKIMAYVHKNTSLKPLFGVSSSWKKGRNASADSVPEALNISLFSNATASVLQNILQRLQGEAE